jgi:hypothetical protein
MRASFPTALIAVALSAAPASAQTAHHGHMMQESATVPAPLEAGQGAFAAIAEIVALLEADPTTDWSEVDIAGLREHLVDMDEVVLRSMAVIEEVPDGIAAELSGEGRTREALQRMVPAHAGELAKLPGFKVEGDATPAGARLVVTSADPATAARIRGLGFYGLMATGSHHQTHHLAIARGLHPHPH